MGFSTINSTSVFFSSNLGVWETSIREVEKFNSRVETPNNREEIRGSILLLTEVQNILLGRLSGTRENNEWGFPGSRKPQNNYSSLLFIKKK